LLRNVSCWCRLVTDALLPARRDRAKQQAKPEPMVEQNSASKSRSASANETGLVADIGATNARFAVIQPDRALTRPRIFALDDHPTIADAIATYLAAEQLPSKPREAAIAIAAPVTGDQVTMTNHPWSFSTEGVRQHFGFRRLCVVNDFAAAALAIPQLTENDRIQIGAGAPVAGAPIGVIGPGTGLGVSGLVPAGNRLTPIQGEGGHVTMAPADARESAVLDLMRRRYDHVSAERLLSGPGLVNLYNTFCELSGVPAAPFTAAQITSEQIWQEDPRAREATAMFSAMLGSVAGNLALTLGARGGIYIAGGIVPKLGAAFAQSGFRERFEAKGRLRDYLATIPTFVIVRPLPILLGAAKLLERE
jgi:glucokinase